MAKCYVSDLIGEEYQTWKPGEKVAITTSTGTGKTSFILKVLLPYARSQGKHIAYFCNRKFLKLQLQAQIQQELISELGEEGEELARYIHIRSYQHAECCGDYPNILALDENGEVIHGGLELDQHDVLYYIFDEAHYVCSDSSFNSRTRYWYEKRSTILASQGLAYASSNAITVFLTATPDPLWLYLGMPPDELQKVGMAFMSRYLISTGREIKRSLEYLTQTALDFGEADIIKILRCYNRHNDLIAKGQAWTVENCIGIRDQAWEALLQECSDCWGFLSRRIQLAIEKGKSRLDHHYGDDRSLEQQYDYLEESYFESFEELVPLILTSCQKGQRWLIFVQSKEEGIRLRDRLSQFHCAAGFLSSEITRAYDGTAAKRKNTRKYLIQELVYHQSSEIPVLIATSVLDNGITLRGSQIRNLAVCQPNTISFLQMIGRLRVREHEKIRIYVQSMSAKQTNAHISMCYQELLYQFYCYLQNQEIDKSFFSDFNDTGMFKRYGMNFLYHTQEPFLRKGASRTLKGLQKDPQRMRYMDVHKSRDGEEKLVFNELSLLYQMLCFYQNLNVEEQIKSAQDQVPYIHLREQLSWIGKHYDVQKWADYGYSRAAVYAYLEKQYTEAVELSRSEQVAFRRKLYDLLSAVREPPADYKTKQGRYSHKSGKYPGKKILNQVFADLGMPFEIKSSQPKHPILDENGIRIGLDQTSYWIIEKRTGSKSAGDS